METRSQNELWCIGQATSVITGHKLPSKRQVLKSYFFFKNNNNVKESAGLVTDQVLDFWQRARFPTKQRYHVITHVEKLVEKYRKLKKNKGRKTETQQRNVEIFSQEIEELFDIAHEDALKLMTIEEDKTFLTLQREGRKGYMSSVDCELFKQEQRILNRKKANEERETKELKRKKEGMCSTVTDLVLTESDSSQGTDNEVDDFIPSSAKKLKKSEKTEKKKVITPAFCSALDRLKIPDRSGSLVLSTVCQGLGANIEHLSTSYESLRCARIENRKEVAKRIILEFKPQIPLTVHWDGKLLSDLTSRNEVDRLPILVTGYDVEKLLSVPKLDRGTGEQMSYATEQALKDWNISYDRIVALCFDTTSSNTGIHSGACTLLEKLIGKSLLYTACRHHIHEVILSHVYKTCFGTFSGPEVKLFQRFRDQWSKLNSKSWLLTDADLKVYGSLVPSAIEFAVIMMQGSKQPRNDYNEFLQLAIIFLGKTPPGQKGITFRSPGAMHQARWMAKALYSIKIYLFRHQFYLTKNEEKNLLRFSIFSILIYMEHWFRAPISSSAPHNDLTLIRKLNKFKIFDKEVAESAIKAIAGHLWYLTEDLVSLSFFSNDVDNQTKEKMLIALEKPANKTQIKRVEGKGLMDKIVSMNLDDFVTNRSKYLFELLGINWAFMKEHCPDKWSTITEYQDAHKIVNSMKVVNDTAERAVKLVSDYTKILTKDETQLQYILQIVEEH